MTTWRVAGEGVWSGRAPVRGWSSCGARQLVRGVRVRLHVSPHGATAPCRTGSHRDRACGVGRASRLGRRSSVELARAGAGPPPSSRDRWPLAADVGAETAGVKMEEYVRVAFRRMSPLRVHEGLSLPGPGRRTRQTLDLASLPSVHVQSSTTERHRQQRSAPIVSRRRD